MRMRKKIVVLLVIFLVSFAAYGASRIDQRIRELEKQLETVSGKERSEILLQLAVCTYSQAPRKCIGYCNQALDLARQFNDPGVKAKALRYLSYAYNVKGEPEKTMERLRKTKPDLKFIFVSGYPDDAFRKSLDDGQDYAFLPKPFTLPQLAAKVKEQLGR